MAFHRAHEHYTILCSMSRRETPTDNPIIESLNGWINEELCLDYSLKHYANLAYNYCIMGNNDGMAVAISKTAE